MAEFIIGVVAGLNIGVGVTGYIYNRKISRLRSDLADATIDLMHK